MTAVMSKYGTVDLLSLLITLGVYYFLDMGSDLRLAFEFYNEGHYLRCWVIITISAFAMYSLNVLACYWENRDYGLSWRSCLFFILPYGLLYQRIRCLALLLPVVFYKNIVEIKGYNIHQLILREDWKAIILALIQTFASNGIHIVWQLRLILHESLQVDSLDVWTKSSIILSIISCSLALSDYHLVRRNVLDLEKYNKCTLLVFFLTQISTVCVVASRFVSITLIITSWLYYIFIVIIIIHWIVSLIAILKWDFNLFHDIQIQQNSDNSSSTEIHTTTFSKTKCCVLIGSVIFSFLLLVTHLETRHKKKIILINCAENITFLMAWYFTTDITNTWHLWFLISTVVFNIAGVGLCLIMWSIFLKQKDIPVEKEVDVAIEMIPTIPADSV